MPTYAYRCRECGHSFERVESMKEHGKEAPPCPRCSKRNVEPRMSRFHARTSRKS